MIFKKSLSQLKFILCFILQWFILSNIFILRAQEQDSIKTKLPVLTTAEMFADFDYYFETIVNFSPQTPVRKAVTGIDPLEELKKMRSQIYDIKSTEEFAILIQSALTVLQDGHSSLLWPKGYTSDYLRDLDVSDDAINLFPYYYELRRSKRKHNKFNLKLKYINGEYYSIAPFEHKGIYYQAGLKITEINDQPAQSFIGRLFPYLTKMRWDYTNKRYYSERFYKAINLSTDQTLKLTFIDKNEKITTGLFKLNQAIHYEENQANESIKKTKKVEYFSNEQILYVRIPKMNLDHVDFYPDEIKAKAIGKPLRKIIIDIRDNPGGTDNVWVNALTAIIDKPIDFELLLLTNPSKEMKKEFADNSANWRSYHAPFLDDYEYAIFASGERQIQPDSNSLNFDGKIYILQNDRIYSSAGAMATMGMLAENIYTVGQNTGWLLGRGINPIVFELPHSKILYRIEPVIDFQNVKTAEDVYHDKVEIPVSLTIDQYLQRNYYKGDIYGREFLFNIDPVFIKALED